MDRHELRNSINPILQSALLVKASLLEARGSDSANGTDSAHGIDIQEDLEACDAIIDSANQMERVANDVLGQCQFLLQEKLISVSDFLGVPSYRPCPNTGKSACRYTGTF